MILIKDTRLTMADNQLQFHLCHISRTNTHKLCKDRTMHACRLVYTLNLAGNYSFTRAWTLVAYLYYILSHACMQQRSLLLLITTAYITNTSRGNFGCTDPLNNNRNSYQQLAIPPTPSGLRSAPIWEKSRFFKPAAQHSKLTT
jgi:hypothetical protein